ncbi:hypothetical protein [Glacieibacterium sp.]|uniref:hypothetical protein n=1 Tax=Glacieibacterium sp. TaxID=2860237 RepID=UPI003B0017AA
MPDTAPPADPASSGASAEIASFGVSADTGETLPPVDLQALARAARSNPGGQAELNRRMASATFGAVIEINEEALGDAGWGVVFARDDPDAGAIEAALGPLLDRRSAEAGKHYKLFKGDDGYQPGDTAEAWLARRGVGLDLVDPELGVPYFLVIVGGPETIPLDFQYRLDLYWACGRLHFAQAADYGAYAANVVRYETATEPVARRAAMFAPRHDFDAATQLFQTHVADPLSKRAPLNQFSWDLLLGDDATKTALLDLLTGARAGGPPALLFTGGHGMEFAADDARLPANQGALVCQEWPGPGTGPLKPDYWFGAADVPAAAAGFGTIHLLFACYGGGYGAVDTFRDAGGQGRRIADHPGFAGLPQALMANPAGGPLAVIAHIDRAFAYSFQTPSGGAQNQGFREIMFALMLGRRAGSALDRFNLKWATVSTAIAERLRDPQADDDGLARLWIQRDDARNYVLFGDPAVKLRLG